MIEINGLNKRLGDKDVLKDINLTVEPGRIFGLVGENGAGKTTLIKCVTGVYRPEKGFVRIAGQTVYENPAVKERIGYVADQNQYIPSYRIQELLQLYCLAYPHFSRERFMELNLWPAGKSPGQGAVKGDADAPVADAESQHQA